MAICSIIYGTIFNYPLQWIVHNCIYAPVMPFAADATENLDRKKVMNVLPVANTHPATHRSAKHSVIRILNPSAATAYDQLMNFYQESNFDSSNNKTHSAKTSTRQHSQSFIQSASPKIDVAARLKVIRNNLIKQYQLLSVVALNNHGDAVLNARNFNDYSTQWNITKCSNSDLHFDDSVDMESKMHKGLDYLIDELKLFEREWSELPDNGLISSKILTTFMADVLGMKTMHSLVFKQKVEYNLNPVKPVPIWMKLIAYAICSVLILYGVSPQKE